jgi:co-chaperonin GroES (HSP10)
MQDRLRPKNDRIHVRLDPRKDKTSGGILLPDSKDQEIRTGVIIDVGPGKYVKHRRSKQDDYREIFRPMEAKPGERVAFFIASVDTRSGKAISHYLQEDERLITEEDILFVIDEGDVEVTL